LGFQGVGEFVGIRGQGFDQNGPEFVVAADGADAVVFGLRRFERARDGGKGREFGIACRGGMPARLKIPRGAFFDSVLL